MDTEDLDKKIEQLTAEVNALCDAANKMINENASGEVNQEEHDRKYKAIQDRYDAIEKELNKLNDEKGKKVGAAERIRIFAAYLEKNGQFLNEFNKKLWTMLVESVTVTNDKKVKFRYYSGYENEVEI